MLALITPLFSPFSRKVLPEAEVNGTDGQSELPPVSVVLTDHDSAHHLAQVLPRLLEQEFPADFQIVVVIDRSDSASEDILKRHSSNPHLYYTMLPDTSRYLSRKKLGITLGIRAAKYDWVLVTDVHSIPSSVNWLAAMASHCTEDKNMVLGMSLYGDDTPAYYRYEQLRTMLYHLRTAQRGIPFSTNQSVVMLRKHEFMERGGFIGNLEFARAEFEFLVNKFAKADSCALALEPQSWMTAIRPSSKRWRMRNLFAMDAFRCMQRYGRFRILFRLDQCMMHLYNLLTVAAVAAGAFMLPELDGIVLLSATSVLWIASIVERCLIYSPVLRHFDNIPPLLAVILDWTISFRNLILRVRYLLADKNDFITHKL